LIRYFDASALVKRYVEEPSSEIVRQGMREAILTTSRLSEVEVTSALVRRWRQGDLTQEALDRTLDALQADLRSLNLIEPVAEITALAGTLLRRHPLRAGDALQLASSVYLQRKVRGKLEFWAFDQRLNEAAAKVGVAAPATAAQ
jgi:predicted nucleic acid-binding protein